MNEQFEKNFSKWKATGVIKLGVFSCIIALAVVQKKFDPEERVVSGTLIKNGIPNGQLVTKAPDLGEKITNTMLYITQRIGDDTVHSIISCDSLVPDNTLISRDTVINVSEKSPF